MITLRTQPSNIGGIAQMVAIPVEAFRSKKVNPQTGKASLTLNSLDRCIDIECNGQENYSDQQTSTDDGILYHHLVQGVIFSEQIAHERILPVLQNGAWLVLVKTRNGQSFLLGTPQVPLTFTSSDRSGKYKNSPAAIEYQFGAMEAEGAFLITYSPF